MGAFDGSIGSFLIGTVLACFLTGITSSQTFQYFQNFPNDRKAYKCLVAGLFLFDVTHTAVSIYTIWDWCVANYGNLEHLLVDPAMVGIVAFVCQSFYAYRVWVIGKRSLAIPVLVVLLSFVSLGFAIGATVTVFTNREFSKFQSYTYGISSWLALAALSDVIITTTLVYHLNKSKTGLLQTNSMLNRLIELLISTNGLTCVIAIIDAILFGTLTESYHVLFNLMLPKLYFNSLLVSLNARVELERRLAQPSSHANETHKLNNLGGGQASHRDPAGTNSQPDVRTALGFGAEDCDPDIVYATRRKTGTRSGIQVTTHQMVITDEGIQSTTYLPSPDSVKKDLPYYNEKEFASQRGSTTPIRSAHFSPELMHAQRFPGRKQASAVFAL